jgi:hypothetical protein
VDVIPFLQGLKTAALNPLAFVAYLAAIGAWLVLQLKVRRNKNLLEKISALPEKDRIIALREEMNIEVVPGGFTAEQRLRSKSHFYYVLVVIVLAAVIVILFAIAKFSPQPEKRLDPKVVQSVKVTQPVEVNPNPNIVQPIRVTQPVEVNPNPNIVQQVRVVSPSVQDQNKDLIEKVEAIDLGVTKDFVVGKLGPPMHEQENKGVSCIDFKLPFALLLFLIDSNHNVYFKYVISTDEVYKPRLMEKFYDISAEKGCLGCFSFHDVTSVAPFGLNPYPDQSATPPEDTLAEIPPTIWFNNPAHEAETYVETFDTPYSWHRTVYLVHTSDGSESTILATMFDIVMALKPNQGFDEYFHSLSSEQLKAFNQLRQSFKPNAYAVSELSDDVANKKPLPDDWFSTCSWF